MLSIVLPWKNFKVDLEKVRAYLKSTLSSNYDGLLCDEASLRVIFKTDYSDDDFSKVNAYWDVITLSTFNPTSQEIVTSKIIAAITFGNNMIVQAAVENVLLGITQANKTKDVSDYLERLQLYLRTGSLYAALQEINSLLADSNRASLNLSPFVTDDRLNAYKASITTFLGS